MTAILSRGRWVEIRDSVWLGWSQHYHDDVIIMETFSSLLAICAGNSPAFGEFPAQRPVTRSFNVFFDLCLNKRLSKQSWSWWFETPSGSLWRCNAREGCHQTVIDGTTLPVTSDPYKVTATYLFNDNDGVSWKWCCDATSTSLRFYWYIMRLSINKLMKSNGSNRVLYTKQSHVAWRHVDLHSSIIIDW